MIAAITLLRVWTLTQSWVNLHGDEAQYWLWSRSLDWGYFSKPPLIAWTIAATTSVFGNEEWAVRLAAPFAHAAAAFALYALGARLYGPVAGALAGLAWAVMPGVWLSASVISTDALLLPLWSLALYAAWRLIETGSWRWGIALGVAIGLGALAKYAMLYFLAGLALIALGDRAARRALLSPAGAIAAAAAGAILAPNLIWNAANGFATIVHTTENANWGAELFNPDELASFLIDQLGVFGPVMFLLLAVFIVGVVQRGRAGLDRRDLFLLAFVLPALLIVVGQSFLSRAHANWAAAAYPAATVWLVGRLWRPQWKAWLVGSLILHGVIGALFLAAISSTALVDWFGASNAFKRARAWDATATAAGALAAGGRYSAIIADDRLAFNALSYYLRDDKAAPPIRMWRLYAEAHNEAEAAAPITPADGARALVLSVRHEFTPFLLGDFEKMTPLDDIMIDLGGGRVRHVKAWVAEGFRPAPRDAAMLARIRGEGAPASREDQPR